MGQNRETIKNYIFPKTLRLQKKIFAFCFFYKIHFVFEFFQPIFIRLGTYVEVKMTYILKENQLGPIENFKIASILNVETKMVENGQHNTNLLLRTTLFRKTYLFLISQHKK